MAFTAHGNCVAEIEALGKRKKTFRELLEAHGFQAFLFTFASLDAHQDARCSISSSQAVKTRWDTKAQRDEAS
ncbi:Ribonuclease T2 [Manis javanica]|nr:Ribonuclease T2 [Manis javanica]